jgi:PAS domain S-box-containing protein
MSPTNVWFYLSVGLQLLGSKSRDFLTLATDAFTLAPGPGVTRPESGEDEYMSSPYHVAARQLSATAGLAARIATVVDQPGAMENVLPDVLRAVSEFGGFRLGQAWVPVPGGSALEWRAAWTASPDLRDFVETSRAIVFGADEGLAGRTWTSRQPVSVADVAGDPGFYRAHAAQAAGLRSALALPVLGDGREVLAVFEFLSEDGRELDRSSADALAEALIPLATLFLRERERVQRESEAVSRRLFESPMIGIVFWERGGRLLDANDAFLEMIAYSREELRSGTLSWDHLSTDEDRLDQWVFRQIEATGVCPPFERECRRKDGRLLTVLMGGSIAPGSGSAVSYVLDVSERRRVLDALRESEERFRAFMDNSPAIAFMKDEEGRHLYVNAPWMEIFRLKGEEVIGRSEYELFPREVAASLREHDRQVFESGRPVGFWEQVPTGDGVLRDWLVFKFPFEHTPGRRLLGGVAVDMTERRRAEAALHASEERYRNLVEHSPDAIFLHTDARITFINLAGVRLLGASSAEEIVGRSIFDILDPAFHDTVRERTRQIAEQGVTTLPMVQRFLRVDGTAVEVEVFATPSREGPRGVQVVARDITERQEAERQRSRLLASEQEARAESQALSRRLVDAQENERRQIARELHDEVGQILTGLSLVLKSGAPPPSPWAERMHEAQGILHDLMRRVREMSLDLRPAMLDDLGLLAALLWHFERYTYQTRIKVRFHHFGLDRRFPAELETATYRIIQEALTNTARYAHTDEVDVHVRARSDVLWLRVADHGSGFEADRMGRSGSMGLAGMRERVAAVGGKLELDSAAGQGTFLTAWLPLDGKRLDGDP